MPVPDHVLEQLRQQENKKRRGESTTFGAAQRTPGGPTDLRTPPSGVEAAQRLVELEAVFGQQAQALASNLRAMLSILGHLQQARMDVFGQGPTAAERAFSTQASTFGVGPDGFFRNEATHSPNDAPPTKNDGGSDGNVSG